MDDRIGTRVKVRELRDGDMIDLEELPFFSELDYDDRVAAESEYAVVGSEDGPHTVETDECWVLHTDQGSFRVGPDWLFTVQSAAPDMAYVGSSMDAARWTPDLDD